MAARSRRTPVAASCLALLGLVFSASLVGPTPGSGVESAALAAVVQPSRPQRGLMLVAVPELPDPNFAESVVLLLEAGHDGGAAGVILNRRSRLPLSDVLPDVAGLEGRSDRLYFGGPVQPSAVLLLVHGRQTEGGLEILPGVYSVRASDGLEELLGRGVRESELRVFAGYAGWAPGQLEAEIARGDWLLYPARPEWVFSDEPEALWKRIFRYASSPIA